MAGIHQAAFPEQLSARVAALEHESELADIQRTLDDTATRVRQQEQQFRQHRATIREIERQLEETEQRSIGVRQRTTAVSKDLERIGAIVDNQERFLTCCSSWRAEAGVAVAQTPAKEPLAPEGKVLPCDGSSQQLWEAVRELEQRLAREAERRAAGQGEVLSVLGQGVQQLRSEQSRHANDMEDRFRLERRRLKQWGMEAQARHSEHEKRADALEARVDALNKALTLERRARTELALVSEDYAREGTARGLGSGRAVGIQPATAAPWEEGEGAEVGAPGDRRQARGSSGPPLHHHPVQPGHRHHHQHDRHHHHPPHEHQSHEQHHEDPQQQHLMQHQERHGAQHLAGQLQSLAHSETDELNVPLLHRLEQLEARVAEVHRKADGGVEVLPRAPGNESSASVAPGDSLRVHSLPSTPALADSVRLLPVPPASDGLPPGQMMRPPSREPSGGTPRPATPAVVQLHGTGLPCTTPSLPLTLHGPSVNVACSQGLLPPGQPATGGGALPTGGPGTPWPSPVRPSTPSPAGTPTRASHAASDPRWGPAPQMTAAPPMHIV
mmetsp:Transcript_81937/g.244350  ORF Transcript_81937/g.244350 Transcript_81937/m.244350 type:complete len:556 (+) Transcript_81937:84-1751(+)